MQQQRTAALELLTHEVDTFIETLNTLRGLKDVAHPGAKDLDANPVWRRAVVRQADLIDPAKSDDYMATMVDAMPLVIAFVNGVATSFTNLDNDEDGLTEEDPLNVVPESVREGIDEARADVRAKLKRGKSDLKLMRDPHGKITAHFTDPEIRWHFWAAVRELEKGAATPSHSALLMRSILTMGVSAFEVLVSNIYRSFLLCNPGAAQDPDAKVFSLRELFDFGSVQDAVDESIFQQADAFSRKGVRSWASWFKAKPLEIDLADLAHDWPRTQELFERRNVVIHNGSRVTRQYLNNVDASLTEHLKEGSALDIAPDYVDESLERLVTLGTLLAYKVRIKLFRKDDYGNISSWISDEQFNLIMKDQFHAVCRIADRAVEPELIEAHRILLRVNGWIARMRIDGPDACRKELEEWDTSALAESYRVVRMILLREDDDALAAIKDLVESGDFTVENLTEWPLFHWLRDAGLLSELIEQRSAEELDQRSIEVAPPDNENNNEGGA